jgi:hypothetical protein
MAEFFRNSAGIASVVNILNFKINNGGTYNHDAVGSAVGGTAADIPGSSLRTFQSGSNVVITKWANGSTPTNLPSGVSWGNLTINVSSLAGSWNQAGNLTSVQGNLNILATGVELENSDSLVLRQLLFHLEA